MVGDGPVRAPENGDDSHKEKTDIGQGQALCGSSCSTSYVLHCLKLLNIRDLHHIGQ